MSTHVHADKQMESERLFKPSAAGYAEPQTEIRLARDANNPLIMGGGRPIWWNLIIKDFRDSSATPVAKDQTCVIWLGAKDVAGAWGKNVRNQSGKFNHWGAHNLADDEILYKLTVPRGTDVNGPGQLVFSRQLGMGPDWVPQEGSGWNKPIPSAVKYRMATIIQLGGTTPQVRVSSWLDTVPFHDEAAVIRNMKTAGLKTLSQFKGTGKPLD